MSDRISVRDLRIETRIGVTDEERSLPRTIVVNLDLDTDTSKAGLSDDLSDTVDYSACILAVTELTAAGEFRLLEHLAEQIAAVLVDKKGVITVTVEVVKEAPPIEAEVGSVAVRIERSGR